MKERLIEHRGVVERIVPHGVIVSILQETACSACAAAQLCHSSEKKEKAIDVPCVNADAYQVGQQVTIVGELGLGLRATLWAYAVPLILLVVVLIIVVQMTGSEGIGALAALLSLVPYYIILYMLRGRLQRKFAFRIKD